MNTELTITVALSLGAAAGYFIGRYHGSHHSSVLSIIEKHITEAREDSRKYIQTVEKIAHQRMDNMQKDISTKTSYPYNIPTTIDKGTTTITRVEGADKTVTN